tara:strand:+ start:5798 stop:6178 length:381 start_codon:yes stop_codon:yes gene_type:complete
MKLFLLLFLSKFTKKIDTKINYFFTSDSIEHNVTDSLDKRMNTNDYLIGTLNTGLNIKEKENKTEELLEMERIQTIFYKHFLLQQLLANISIFEKEKIVDKYDLCPTKEVDITAGGLLDDWNFPEF